MASDTAAPAAADTAALSPAKIRWQTAIYWLSLGTATIICFGLTAKSDGPTEIMMAAVALASSLSSIAGFAFSAICGAMLFHLPANPVQIVQIMIVCSIANQAFMVWAIRHAIRWRDLGVFLAAGLAGLPVGVAALLCLDRHVYTFGLGVFLLAYGSYMLFRKPIIIIQQHIVFDVIAGFLGGITGGAVGFPGASVTIWCGLKGWSKDQQRAVFQPFILFMQIAALLTISLVRHANSHTGFDLTDLLCIPPGLLGTGLGMLCYRRLSDTRFGQIVNVLLIVSGVSYVV